MFFAEGECRYPCITAGKKQPRRIAAGKDRKLLFRKIILIHTVLIERPIIIYWLNGFSFKGVLKIDFMRFL